MLLELSVKNLALIEEIKISFKPGFSVVSGETGAGKSILVGALGLISGARGDADLVRAGADEAVVEASFDITPNQEIIDRLREAGLYEGEDLIIRRHLSSEGRSRIYINGHGATVGQLEKIASGLIDLSGQHDQQLLLHEENHRFLLDQHPSIAPLLSSYALAYHRAQERRRFYDELSKKIGEREERMEFLRFQLGEIQKAFLKEEEEEVLIEERGRVKNLDLLFSLANLGEEVLQEGEGALLGRLTGLSVQVEKGKGSDASLQEVLDLLAQARIALEEAEAFFAKYREKLVVEPGRLEEIESRLFLISRLKKKFGGSVKEVLVKEKEMREELDVLEHHEERLAEREKELREVEAQMQKMAVGLSEARKKRALELQKKIQRELASLSMPGVCFRISVEEEEYGPFGKECVRFDMAPNRGEGFRPLAKIASGGELSRILLAIKLTLVDGAQPITYVFDEIDTGIGGGAADVVGQKLSDLGKGQQVLCVTHLPQMASHAQGHYVIEKGVAEKRTRTLVRTLQKDERVEELARMLGGMQITDKTRAHAKEMLRIKD